MVISKLQDGSSGIYATRLSRNLIIAPLGLQEASCKAGTLGQETRRLLDLAL